MDKLLKLAKRHAEISAEIKINKEQMQKELSYCDGGEFVKPEFESGVEFEFMKQSKYLAGIPTSSDVKCSHYSYITVNEFNRVNDDCYSYEEILFNYGCRHCNSVRSLKKHIGELGRERGRIHTAITNIGKTLL